jgi:hypothetical protein
LAIMIRSVMGFLPSNIVPSPSPPSASLPLPLGEREGARGCLAVGRVRVR